MEDDKSDNITSTPLIFAERTLALIKPDAVDKAPEIEDIILRSGFTILQVHRYIRMIIIIRL